MLTWQKLIRIVLIWQNYALVPCFDPFHPCNQLKSSSGANREISICTKHFCASWVLQKPFNKQVHPQFLHFLDLNSHMISPRVRDLQHGCAFQTNHFMRQKFWAGVFFNGCPAIDHCVFDNIHCRRLQIYDPNGLNHDFAHIAGIPLNSFCNGIYIYIYIIFSNIYTNANKIYIIW